MAIQPQSKTEATDLTGIALDRHLLGHLLKSGAITPKHYRSSLIWLHPPHLWAHWAMILMVTFGTALVLSGIVYFFAFNWVALPDLAKFAILQSGMVLAALGAQHVGPGRLIGQLCLLTASVFVGVFLAVFGQVYQSGADAWQLFALWALLIAPWTFLSRFAPLWLIWLGLINLSLALWWSEAMSTLTHSAMILNMTLVAINGAALILRESVTRDRKETGSPIADWLAPLWTRWLLIVTLLLCLFPQLFELVTQYDDLDSTGLLLGMISLLVALALFAAYRRFIFDVPALAMILLMASLLATIAIAVFLDRQDMAAIGVTFFTGLFAIASFALAATYLRRLLALSSGRASDG